MWIHGVRMCALQKYLVPAALDSTDKATCQSSNKFGYSSGSARDSAAFGLTYKETQTTTYKTPEMHFSKII